MYDWSGFRSLAGLACWPYPLHGLVSVYYWRFIISYLDYTCPVFHYALTKYLHVEAQERSLYATSTFPKMHLICPPSPPQKKFCITFVFHFSWVLQPSQEKLKTMLMQNVLGGNKVHYGKCESGVLRFPRRLLRWYFEACWCWLHKTRRITNNSLIYSCWLFQSVLLKTHPKIFTFFAARTVQPPISALRSRLQQQQQQLYLY